VKKTSMKLAFAAVALAIAVPAMATNGMRMIGFSPVQNSMGGAGAAASLDAATIVTNPAGIGALGNRADLSVTVFMPMPAYSATGAASGATFESDRPIDFVPTLAATFQASDKLSFGIAALGTSGMGVEYGQDLYGGTTMSSYLNMRVAPAASYKFTDRLTLGFAANFMYARMEYAVAGGMGMQPREAAGALGYGATFGLSYATEEGATLAVSYETKSRFEDFSFDIPPHNLVVGFDGLGNPIFAPIPGGTETLDFDQPSVLTFGVSFKPMTALLVAADAQWIRWTSTNGENLPAFTSNPMLTGGMPWNLDWSDQLVFKLGAQYDMTEEIKVRAGYNWGANPLKGDRAFENIAFPAVSVHHFTLGAGYQFGSLTVNVAAVYSPESKLEGANAAQNIGSYETTMSQLAFDVGAAWKF